MDPLQDEPAYPTVLLQVRQNIIKFSNCVLLTRVGGFYEMYFEHAVEIAPLLNIKLASKKTNAGPVAMAGFPFFQLDRFLKILVQDLGRFVAIADEFPNDASEKIKSGGLMHDRKVTRVITPGTLIDENFIDPYANNYVMAIHVSSDLEASLGDADTLPLDSLKLGLAWLDLSTGHFLTQQADLTSLPSILSRISPREVVLNQSLQLRKDHALFSILAQDQYLTTYATPGALNDITDWTPFLEAEVPSSARDNFTPLQIGAGCLVLSYVTDRLQGMTMKLQPPLRYEALYTMSIDKNSLRALEIKETIRDGVLRGSLFHAIRRTTTKGGTRLLNQWLSAPSTSLDVINQRQNLVSIFMAAQDLEDAITSLLSHSHDSQRLVQKFVLGRGNADDLLALASTIMATEKAVTLLTTMVSQAPEDQITALQSLTLLLKRIEIEKPMELAVRIKDAIDEDGLVQQHQVEHLETSQMMARVQTVAASEGSDLDLAAALPKSMEKRTVSLKEHYGEDNEVWVMKQTASPMLVKLHAELEALCEEKTRLTETLRDHYQAPTLKLRWTTHLGHHVHVKGKSAHKDLGNARVLSASRSTRSLHVNEWTMLGQRLDHARFSIRREEQRVFQTLRELVIVNIVRLRRNAAVLDELDIATSFARLATDQDLVRPRLNDSTCHTILGGRHPTVEGGLLSQGRSFVRNDCLVGTPAHGRLWLITGPNMAGKSTFLRQNALITILAQIGCYVPAAYAQLGVVDAIFSRVGSADSLYHDQSTFMVEMLETAHILRHATPRSFVVIDEIGRGTTPEDGAAVSYACLHHLATVNKCRTLFATHFHSIADLAAADGLCDADGGVVQMYCTDVTEDDRGGFVYVHKLRKGINYQSHALKVARLAGLPERAITVARRVLDRPCGSGLAKGAQIVESL
ncbi:hypothetical protein CDD81_1695 [Ophiocordyceps australis]|uniref:DNA mismatch repair proteins mutS family domain-containing protein n=1 Tax=Ophiocordyceps australis TaxID=1399860 RepID=A0A2C5XVD5_9HYPO|nr:hypothetical protein CDD81_1695 [Ophiocordyceps australis]